MLPLPVVTSYKHILCSFRSRVSKVAVSGDCPQSSFLVCMYVCMSVCIHTLKGTRPRGTEGRKAIPELVKLDRLRGGMFKLLDMAGMGSLGFAF